MSVNPQFPPTSNAKTITAVAVAVVALHALVAVGLATIKTSDIMPPIVTPPLEIAFIQPPEPVTPPTDPLLFDKTPLATSIEPSKPVEAPTPDVQPLPTQPTKTADDKPTPAKAVSPTDSEPPVETNKPTTAAPKPPVVKPVATEPQEPKPSKTQPTPTNETPPEPTVTKTVADEPTVKDTPVTPAEPVIADNSKSKPVEPFAHMVQPDPTASQKKAEQARIEQEKAQRGQVEWEAAEKTRLTQEKQAQAERAKAEQAKVEQAKAETEKTEQEKQVRQANSKIDDSGKTQWKNRPNITLTRSLSEIGKRKNITNMTVRVSFSATGTVTDVEIIQSSGDSQIDTYLQRQVMKGKLSPYAPNGVAVAGTFILPIRISYPK